jgi:hypothetical protein
MIEWLMAPARCLIPWLLNEKYPAKGRTDLHFQTKKLHHLHLTFKVMKGITAANHNSTLCI